jgi:hypothetical protein
MAKSAAGYGQSVQLGNAGEHLVMAHLLELGFQAFRADRANPAFDISVVDGNRHSLIRVKATRSPSVVWSRKKSGITFLDLRSRGDYCAIVDLRGGIAGAKIYIVPTPVVQRAIDSGRREWNAGLKRDGSRRKDSTGQRLWLDDRDDLQAWRGYCKRWARYVENWDQLRSDRSRRNVGNKAKAT